MTPSQFPSQRASTSVAIIGAGLMGRGIAQIAAQAGFEVMLIDSKPGAASTARQAIGETLKTLTAKGKIVAADAERALDRITLPDELAALAGAHLVVEAIVEQLEAKRSLFRSLETIVSDRCILATNTSSLSVTAIAAACVRPERVAGLHFFSPVPVMKLVEVIDGLLTSQDVVQRLVDFGAALGHKPVRAKDTPGFIVNHAGRGLGTEALRILGEGIAGHDAIDRILKGGAGFRMGPFELLDLTGLDVSHPVMESIYHQYYEEPRFRPSPVTAQRLAAGVLGRKSGRGFYEYGGTGTATASPRASPQPPTAKAPHESPVPRHVWIGPGNAREGVTDLLRRLGAIIDDAQTPASDSICLLLPLGIDATTAAIDAGVNAAHTVALDTLPDLSQQRTLMSTPVTDQSTRQAALALLGVDGVNVELIHDSPGFIIQRVLAHIVNVACDIAQQRIATPADIDLAVQLGLGYPKGPLAWGDAIGPERVVAILQGLSTTYGDPRYRASVWLSRRARLGVSLLTPEA